MSLNQLKAGAFLAYISIVLNMLIGLLYTPYMLRMMGQSEYGLYSLAASLIAYLTILDLGFGDAIVRYTAKFRAEGKVREQQELFGMFFLLYIGIGLIALMVGWGLFANVENLFAAKMTPEEVGRTRTMLGLMILNLAFTFPMSIWGAIITAYERFVFLRVVSIVRAVLNPIVMVALLIVGYKAVAMVVVMTIFNVVTLNVNYWYCKYRLNIKIRFARFEWFFLKEVSIYSFWIFLNVIMDRIYWSSGQFILGIYRGTEAVAVYAVAVQLKDIFYMFSTAISGVFLPKIMAMITKGSSEQEVSELFIKTGRLQYILLSFIFVNFILWGRPFVNMWAGADYDQAYGIAVLFFVPSLVPLIQNLGITILRARNQMRFRSLLYIVVAVLSLGISIPLAKLYGGVGCAIGTGMALICGQIIVMNVYYQKKVHIEIIRFWKEIIKMSFVPIVVGGVASVILNFIVLDNIWVLGFAVFVFSGVYLPLFWFMSMNQYERDLFSVPIRRLLKK